MNTQQQERILEDAELYPDGRQLFYDGSDKHAFLEYAHAMGFDISISVHVPSNKLHEVESAFRMGS